MRVGLKPDTLLDRVAIAAGLVPAPIFEAYFAAGMARAVMAGIRLGVFRALEQQPDDAAGLARRLNLDERGLDVLLEALADLDYVRRRKARYRLTRRAKSAVPGHRSVDRWTGEFGQDMWEAFGSLEEAVRTGEHQGLHSQDPDDPYWGRYMRGLEQLARLSAPRVAKLIGAEDPKRLVDLAGGHGAFAVALCERHPHLRATVVELEGAARHGRELVAARGMAGRITYAVGDLFATDLGTGADLVTAHNIVHHFDAAQNVRMLTRARAAMRPGGTVAVFDLERGGGQPGALTGLLFYVTSGARTWTGDEMAGLVRSAGFADVRVRRHPEIPGSFVVLGTA